MGLFFSSSFHIMQCLDYSLNCEDIVGIGCCRVVSAFNNDTGAPAVGKLLDLTQDKATQLKFFYNEAQMLSKLNSLNCSHIVKMEKSGIVDKFGVIILERLEDDLLELILSTDLNINQKMQIFSEICFGIKECHDNGLLIWISNLIIYLYLKVILMKNLLLNLLILVVLQILIIMV